MEHKHKTFHLELSELRTRVTGLGELVIEQFERALVCLKDHKVSDAHNHRAGRQCEPNGYRCGRDLPAVTCPSSAGGRRPPLHNRGNEDYYRTGTLGDRVVNICEAVADGGVHDPISTDAQVLRIGHLATAMVRDAMAAFSRSDPALVKSVWEKEKEFDALYSHVVPNLITSLAKDPERIARDARLALLSKDLNEISEHATNIAEVVMFMVEGKELSHMDMYERRPWTD